MPRRRPSRVRAESRDRSPYLRDQPGPASASSALVAALRVLDRERFLPGAGVRALRRWAEISREPRPYCCPCCDEGHREVIEVALHALPPRTARELRALVEPLDAAFAARTSPDPFAPPDDPWWLRRHAD